MLKRIIILLIVLFTTTLIKAQPKTENVTRLNEDAEVFMEDEDWDMAYACYDKLTKLEPTNYFFKFQKGRCGLHLPDKKLETITLFEEVRKESPQDDVVLYFLGRAYHSNYKFEEAIKYFDDYLATDPKDADLKDEAMHFKDNSIFGQNLTKTMVEADIKNLGAPVNTSENEYVPVISTDESVLIYTYKGKRSVGGLQNEKFKPDLDGVYYEDVFMSKKQADSTWGEPEGISEFINTNHNDASIALSPDGQELYTFYSDKKNGGDIYICHLLGDTWSKPEALSSNINTEYWEGSCSITADGKNLFFASERPGGVGKRDLYVSQKQADGSWGPAENLGPIINTKYNDDDPFIHPDGITLFFSSQGHKSIGGFDIMYSIKKDGKWIEPTNMGYPLNTTDDDRYYVITAKGDRGYFSSNRNSIGGTGNQDIYTVTPGIIGERPILAMVLGNVYGNDEPIEAKLEVIKKSTGEVIGPFSSNKKTGKYLVALSPGENYTFKIKAESFPDYQEDLDIAKLTKFIEIHKDFHLAKDGFVDPHLDTAKKLNDFLSNLLDTITSYTNLEEVIKNHPIDTNHVTTVTNPTDPCAAFKTLDFSALKNKSLNDPKVYGMLMAIADKINCSKIQFKVQIAAYRKPQNYKWDHLKEFGTPEEKPYPDGITRFTQGSFTDIMSAEAQRRQAIAKGQKDAWIVGFIDGKRYTLEELIMVDFFNKNLTQFNENLQLLQEYLVLE
ncbi:MAG: hypothetical protein Q8M29_11225 [Bacteroidota bacterium]|nr:hypothetical protein [Bacteroidota bacterium]